MWQRHDGVPVYPRHRLGRNHRVHHSFLSSLDSRQEYGIDLIIGKHGKLAETFKSRSSGISCGEGNEDISGPIAGIAAVPRETQRHTLG